MPLENQPLSATDGGRSRLDRTLNAINHSRRRRTLYHLREDNPAEIEAVAKRIAAYECDADQDDVPDDDYMRVLTSLYHVHLPRLDELGIVDYDQRSGGIKLDDCSEEFDALLDIVRSIEEGTDRHYTPGHE